LGGVRRSTTWRQFILALGVHTEQEMAKDGFGAYWAGKGRNSGVRLSGGHFIGHLAMHFGLVNDEELRGLQVVARELPLIDLHEIGRLHIYARYGDTWAWVAEGPKRQQAGVIESFTTEQSRVSTWLITCMTQLMDASVHTYQPFDNTLIGSSGLSYRRLVRPKTGDSSTSAAPHTDAQPDP
ncbi:hypothetical protein Tco_1463997, partial [Tanacetum coccineum]